MATLVQFLAAGVNGAANGSATFLLRGTASSAAAFLYNDFERTAQPGTNVITLDANGAAEVYCSVYVDVAIRNSAGTLLRTVTLGNSSGLVEVRSTSFRGDDYDGNPSNTLGEPLTLTTLLNRWDDSAGAPDFQVLVDGVAVDLESALAGLAGLFINVKDPQYGAVGDGVTDDTTAISNAIAATIGVGGVVFFPPGTYAVEQIVIASSRFCLLGFGQATLFGIGSGGSILSSSDTNPGLRVIHGLKFDGNGSPDRAIDLPAPMQVLIEGCEFDEYGFGTHLIRFRDGGGIYQIRNCVFTIAETHSGDSLQHTSGADKRVQISDCHFSLGPNFVNAVISGSCFSISNCVFDGSQVTAGTYHMIDPHDPSDADVVAGTVSGCTFIDGGSSGHVFDLLLLGDGCEFSEDCNNFFGFSAPTLTAASGVYDCSVSANFDDTSQVRLGSRLGRTLHFTNSASATFTAQAILDAENIVVEHSNSNLTTTVPAILPGLAGRIIVFAANGEPSRSLSFVDSSGVGQVLNTATITEENILSTAGSDEVASCGYLTTMRGDGTLRSLITSEVNHHT